MNVYSQEDLTELRYIIEDRDAEIVDLQTKIAALEPMRMEYERGGFAEIIKNLNEQVRVLKTRVESESAEKVKNLRAADFWRKKAIDLGYSRNAVIDLQTG